MVKHFNKKRDPHLKREAENYEHPVPSREYIIDYLESKKKPFNFQQLLVAFDLHSQEEKEGLKRRLKAMCRDGQLLTNRRGRFALVTQMELIKGRVVGHRDGYGFLIRESGEGNDIFLPAREMEKVFPNDVVLIRTSPHQQRQEGAIIEILERNTQQVVGRFFEEKGLNVVTPDNKNIARDIIIPPKAKGKAKDGQFVVVAITTQPSPHQQPVGRVIEILGDHLTRHMEVDLAVRSYGIPFQWPEAVLTEVQALKSTLQVADKENREDLSHLPFVTIDGEDAKDFDDAVYCEPLNKGWRLFVAIADVAHYVKVNSALDKEAYLRGNSVYFPTKVIPMLPEVLSNHLCSLKPHTERLSMVCIIKVSERGVIENYQFKEALIYSQARLTYTEVANILRGKNKSHQKIEAHLKNLYALYQKLLSQRKCRGAIEFDTLEAKFEFDENGKIKDVHPLVRNDAHRLIEEAMLLANVCAAQFLLKGKLMALFRNHEGPQPERLSALRDFLKPFGLRLSGGNKPSTQDYSRLIARIAKRADSHLLQTVLLRSLQQAIYSPKNVGHFGLAYEGYTHFTSPIRRYPDLIVHRAIKHLIHRLPKKSYAYNAETITYLGEHCSMTERRADRATRDASDWLKCEYMKKRVGQIFKGRIVEVTGFGVFVELDEIFVQGLLHVTSLKNDYYHHDAIHHLLRGKRSGQTYRLGDSIRVLVAKADLDTRKIDFELID